MSIQYSGGTLVNATTTQSAGTRAELADWIKTQLVAAGWSSVTNATSDYTLTSATTPQSLAVKVRVYDPGTGNCTRLKFSDGTGAKTQAGDLFLLPAAAQAWRLLANKYQFFVKAPGSVSPRQFAAGGVLWVPSFLSTSMAVWCQGNAITDTDASARTSFASMLASTNNSGTTTGNLFHAWNGLILEANGAGLSTDIGVPALMTSMPAIGSGGWVNGYRWADGTLQVVEPLFSWGATAASVEGQIRGQLWDAIVLTDSFAAESQITFDSHTWQAITHGNAGNASQQQARGTLFVAGA